MRYNTELTVTTVVKSRDISTTVEYSKHAVVSSSPQCPSEIQSSSKDHGQLNSINALIRTHSAHKLPNTTAPWHAPRTPTCIASSTLYAIPFPSIQTPDSEVGIKF